MKTKLLHTLLLLGIAAIFPAQTRANTLVFTIENFSPDDGIWIMRPWIGLHDGLFQTFTVGQPASSGIQHIAEDGISGDVTNLSLLSGPPNAFAGDPSVYNASKPGMYTLFNAYADNSQQATIGGPTIPGGRLFRMFSNVNPLDPKSRFLSYVVMLVPSNDAFFGSDSAHPIRLYDARGKFNGGKGPIRFRVRRSQVLDAGTEVNTEIPADTAFFGQSVPGTGTHPDSNPVIHKHPGFGPNIVNGSNVYPGSQLNYFRNANPDKNDGHHGDSKDGERDGHGGQDDYIAEITIYELP